MENNEFILDIDLKIPNYINEPRVRQNDDVYFIINITDDGIPFDLAGVTTITLAAERSDRNSVISGVTSTEGNQAVFKLPRASVGIVGRATALVQMYDNNNRISTFSFTFMVERDPSNYNPTGDERTLIEIVLGEGPRILDEAEQATIFANEQGNYAKTEADKFSALNDAVTDNEATRITNEQTRQVNESERLTNETDRAYAESDRVSNEDARILAETARQDAEATRASQEAQRQTDTAGAITESQDATEAANTAALNAGGKAQLAQDKVDELSGLNTEIGQAISDAETARNEAVLAAQDATAKAELAQVAGTYANTQGQRAEDAADAIEGALEDGMVLSVNGQMGIVNLTVGDVGAVTPQELSQAIDDISLPPPPDLTPYAKQVDLQTVDDKATTTQNALTTNEADYMYQIPTIVGTQIRINRLSDTNRLFFKLDADLTGDITISTDGGTTEKPVVDVDQNQITQLEKGFVEVVADASFFILRNRGISGADRQALIDIVNEAKANESDLKQLFINDINSKDGNAGLTESSTWFETLNTLSNMEMGKRWRRGVTPNDTKIEVSGLGFKPSIIIWYAPSFYGVYDASVDNTNYLAWASISSANSSSLRAVSTGIVINETSFSVITDLTRVWNWIAFE